MNNKKIIWTVVVVILIILAVALALKGNKSLPGGGGSSTKGPGALTAPSPSPLSVKSVDNSQLPSQLPTDLPIEAAAKVTQNFETTNSQTGKKQSTRVYVSQKTLQQNFDIYQTYMVKNGWKITSTINQASLPNVKAISATKNNVQLDIQITQDPKTKIVNVNVSLTY